MYEIQVQCVHILAKLMYSGKKGALYLRHRTHSSQINVKCPSPPLNLFGLLEELSAEWQLYVNSIKGGRDQPPPSRAATGRE